MPVETFEVRSRHTVQQLTDDLGWLEQHARTQPDRAEQATRLRLAAALVRNSLSPFLEGSPPTPSHIAVVGGAGAGKSTITNFLTGAVVAEANPQAGFTRHPIAYTSSNGPLAWSQYAGFFGPLERLFDSRPGNLDEDVYQVRRIQSADPASLLGQSVVWDCPDMTTWQATGYVSRLLEAVAAADLVIYVASDERYNDEVPTQFLQLFLQAGKPVVACLMKMQEHQAQTLIDHFRREVIARIPECTRVAACLPVPHLTPEELADPVQGATRYRQPLVEQVSWWTKRPTETRRAAVRGALEYLVEHQEHFLAAAQNDLAALKKWRDLVQVGRSEFESRYAKEYLEGEKFPRFNEALVRLIQLLELPGVGQYVSKALWVARTPYRLAKGLFTKFRGAPPSPSIPEEPVMNAALTGWLDLLRKEAARHGDAHALWDHVEKGFQGRLPDQVQAQFQRCLREFQLAQAQETEATARAIYEDLEKNPVALNSLRSVKFGLEAGGIGSAIITMGLSPWDALWPFIIAPVVQELVEFFGKQYVDMQKERARQRQKEVLTRTVAEPLTEWLAVWPATGGSTFEKLKLTLQRIPDGIASLNSLVRQRLEEKPA